MNNESDNNKFSTSSKNSETKGMTIIVKTITRIIAGFIFLYGWYIVFHGHLTPGGGFAGGVILCASFVLLILSFGATEIRERTSSIFSSIFESLGGLLFLLVILLGFFTGAFFFTNVLPKGTPLKILSAGVIPIANIAIGIKVGAGLLSIFIAFAALHYIMKE
ncbi:MAG: MnhB domain-containing protein [candidate division WOR-3 bacterium]